MLKNTSTFLAFVSILTILAVLGVAINDSDHPGIRNPFPNPAKKYSKEVANIAQPVQEVTKAKTENQVNITEKGNISFGVDKESIKTIQKGNILNNINNETLRAAGFLNFVIQPKPFNGMLFDKFDLSVLGNIDVTQKVVNQLKGGNEFEVMNAYEFHTADRSAADELFELIKLKCKDDLNISINQTNQLGIASFFINFKELQKNAFLVVKTKDNVYALSYPKATLNENGEMTDYFKPVSQLIQGLL